MGGRGPQSDAERLPSRLQSLMSESSGDAGEPNLPNVCGVVLDLPENVAFLQHG